MSDWPPGCPRYKRQTLITVGDASGPHGCLACADLPKPGEASAVARIPEAKKRGRR